MREIFEDVHSLIMYYQFIKASVTSISSILPTQDFGDKSQAYRAQIQRSTMEEKFTFIVDVESFTGWYGRQQRYYVTIPQKPLLDIFQFAFCKGIARYQSWGQMAMSFGNRIKKGEPMPRRFRHRQHLRVIAEGMRDAVSEYYINRGMVLNKIVSESAVEP